MASGPIVRASDRLLICGFTGSGKSVWLDAHARQLRQQIIVVDAKGDDHWKGGEHANVYNVRDLARELQRHRVVRIVIDDELDRPMLEQLFQVAWDQPLRQAAGPDGKRPGVLVLIHDAIGMTDSNYAPRWLRRIMVQGRSRGVRVWAGAQRPVGFSPYLRDQADHILIAAQRWSTRDLANLSTELGYDSPRQLRDELSHLNAQYGDLGRYAYLHFERAAAKIWARPPLPDWMRR